MKDFVFGLTDPFTDIAYDIETYPNCFTLAAEHVDTGQQWWFEITKRKNDSVWIWRFLETLNLFGNRMAGYNNLFFDYPVIHYGYKNRLSHSSDLYDKAMEIIDTPPIGTAKWRHVIWERDTIVPQLDLFKMRHYDNAAKSTSLKILEFNMAMDSIMDLPFAPGTEIDEHQLATLKHYNLNHDVRATVEFYHRTVPLIKLREKITDTLGQSVLNDSDVKIGEKILVTEMEKRGIECYAYVDGKKKKRQTHRDEINLGDVIFPYVQFERPEFRAIVQQFKDKTLRNIGGKIQTKGAFDKMECNVDGLDYTFGTGGLHASVESQIVHTTDEMQIVDVDVASYYPNLGIKNKLFPGHLGEEFCDAYLGVYHTRKTYPKKTPENEAYKLALNGAFGGSNNEHSPFYDPYYTMSITINGQLLLCMLAEQLIKTPGLKMIQCNTDGVTFLCPKKYLNHAEKVCTWWEELTQLELECEFYSAMFIRDCNNYIAVYQ